MLLKFPEIAAQKTTPMHLMERWDEVHRGADRDCTD